MNWFRIRKRMRSNRISKITLRRNSIGSRRKGKPKDEVRRKIFNKDLAK